VTASTQQTKHLFRLLAGLRLAQNRSVNFHHGIRGEEADGDAVFCRELAERHGIPFREGRADVPALARSRGIGLETAAREARYAFLRSAAAELNCDAIALAHHRDDQAETVLMHALRGSGIRGLSGMEPERDGLVRPLLGASKREILEFLEANGVPWREDRTNREDDNPRNALRNRIMPQLESVYPGCTGALARLAETGTGLDTAVYCNMATMKTLLAAAEEKGVTHKITSQTSDLISAVYVKVRDDCDVGTVNSALNGHVRRATAVRARSMFTDVSDSLAGISRTVAVLVAAVWALAFIILLIAFSMMIHERRREFAVLRLLGTSRRALCGLVLAESALCSLAGGLLGVGAAALAVFPFTALIESRLGLPYLTPDGGTVLALALATVAGTVLVGALASGRAAWRLSRTDPGTTLREGA